MQISNKQGLACENYAKVLLKCMFWNHFLGIHRAWHNLCRICKMTAKGATKTKALTPRTAPTLARNLLKVSKKTVCYILILRLHQLLEIVSKEIVNR